MNSFTMYLWEASICLGVFYLFYVVVLRRQSSFRYNRCYLLATSALGGVLPLLNIPLRFSTGKQVVASYLLLSPAEASAAATETVIGAFAWLWIVYILGVLTVSLFYGRQFFFLYRVIQCCRTQPTTQGNYRLLYTDGKFPTASFFHYLFWDNTQPLTVAETQQVMRHEETHIQRGHSYDVLYMTLLKTIAWFHPLVYLYDRALTQVHEYEADAGVLAQQPVSQKAYARLLSKHMLNSRNVLPVNHFFYPSQILNRINMLYTTSQKTPWYRYVLVAPAFGLLFLIFSCQEESEITKLDDLAQQYQAAENQEERAALADADEVFMVVEDQPTPEGGMKAFYQYVAQNMKYPTEARQMGIEGKVFVQFVVDKDGSLTDVKALKGIGAGCDEEAMRVIREAPVWNPGQQRGRAVRVRLVMPITFRLGTEEPRAEVNEAKSYQGDMRVEMSKRGDLAEGTLYDAGGNPLPGGNVVIKGTKRGTVTDFDGKFSLQLTGNDSEQALVVSFVGYPSKLIKL